MNAADDALQARLLSRLDLLRGKDRLRQLSSRRGLDFSSNDYLGLTEHPAIREAVAQALRAGVPLGSGGSRLLRGNDRTHERLERRLAAFKGTEAALVFNSGYEANVGLMTALCAAGDVVFSDALVHASMIDGIRATKAERVVFPHNDLAALEQALARFPRTRTKIIAVESLYSMDGDRAPLPQLARLAEDSGACLIVDEAHATGVHGPGGAGLLAKAGVVPLASVHTCGKALGGFGAFVACSQVLKDYLVNACRRFVFTTAPPPLMMAQIEAALDVLEREPWRRERVLASAARLRAGLSQFADIGASDAQITPVILGSDRAALSAAAALQAEGFDIRAIRPPTVPRGTARLRIAVNAKVDDADIDRLIAACRRILADAPTPEPDEPAAPIGAASLDRKT